MLTRDILGEYTCFIVPTPGSGRVTFNNQRSYLKAVSAAFVEIKTTKFTKKVRGGSLLLLGPLLPWAVLRWGCAQGRELRPRGPPRVRLGRGVSLVLVSLESGAGTGEPFPPSLAVVLDRYC